jgi:hypothetical protein
MFGQLLPNKNKMLQYITVSHNNSGGTSFGQLNQAYMFSLCSFSVLFIFLEQG